MNDNLCICGAKRIGNKKDFACGSARPIGAKKLTAESKQCLRKQNKVKDDRIKALEHSIRVMKSNAEKIISHNVELPLASRR
jgi:hypothetical protein